MSCTSNGEKFIGHWIAIDGSELEITNSGKNIYSIVTLGSQNENEKNTFSTLFRGKSTFTGQYENECIKAEMGVTFSFKDNAIIYNGTEYYKK